MASRGVAVMAFVKMVIQKSSIYKYSEHSVHWLNIIGVYISGKIFWCECKFSNTDWISVKYFVTRQSTSFSTSQMIIESEYTYLQVLSCFFAAIQVSTAEPISTELSKNTRTVLQTMVTSRKVKPKDDDDSTAGEGWLGLEQLHKITRKKLYRLKITLTSRNWTEYVAYYDWLKVGNSCLTTSIMKCQDLPYQSV